MSDPNPVPETTPVEIQPTQAPAAPAEPVKPAEPPKEAEKPAEAAKPAKPPEEPDYKAQAANYAARAVQAEARAALTALGVPQARLDAALKIADLGGISLDAKDAAEKIGAAAAKVLELVPEFKAGAGTGSPVATPRKPGTLDDFQRGYLGEK